MSTISEEPLGSLVEFIGGGTPSRSEHSYFNGTIPWVTPKDMGEFDIGDAQENITPEAVQNSATKVLPPGVVLIVVRSGVLKHSLPIGVTTRAVAINQDLKALKCSERLDPRYLARVLMADAGTILGSARGTTAAAIPLGVLRKLRIPLPPLAEQRRIATVLDKLGTIRTMRAALPSATDRIRAAAFRALFRDVLASPRDSVLLEDASEIVSGVTKGRTLSSAATRLVPYLRVANVQDGFLDLTEVKTIEAATAEIERYRLVPADIVLTEGGDPDKLGRGAIWQGEVEECIHQNHVFRVRLTSSKFRPEYVSALLGSPYGKKYFLRAAKQTTGIASINRTQLGAFPLLSAPVELQERFALIVERTRHLESKLSAGYESAKALERAVQSRLLGAQLTT